MAVFDDLAQEAIITCRQNLCAASSLLSSKAHKESDAKLFLIRHLLILKEMTAGLNLGKKGKGRDWRGITDFLRSLLDTAGTMFGYSRGAIISSGQVVDDAKSDIDRELKKACEELIKLCISRATAPLGAFLRECTAYLSSRPSNATDLSSQTFATPEKVAEIHAEFLKGVKGHVEDWTKELWTYLREGDTVNVLVGPAQLGIVDAYRQFHDLVRAEYDFSTAAAITTPSGLHALLTREGGKEEIKEGVVENGGEGSKEA